MTLLPHPDSLSPAQADHLLEGTARVFGLTVADLTGRDRFAPLVRARCAAVWLLRARGNLNGAERSYPVIGRLLGGRDHSSVIHLFRKAEGLGRGRNEGDVAWADRVRVVALADDPRRVAMRLPEAIASLPSGQCRMARAVEKALAGSRTRYGEGVCEDDTGARMRARGSLGLLAAIEAYRAGLGVAA